MLFSIDWPNLIVWFIIFLEISGNMCIVIICFSACDVINFEINLSFLIQPFSYMKKQVKTKT